MSEEVEQSRTEGRQPAKLHPELLNEWRERMDAFRQELREYRNSHFNKDSSYLNIEEDPEYQHILKVGGFVLPEDVKRFYPNAGELFKKRAPVRQSGSAVNTEKRYGTPVYIKEFFEDPEVVKMQIAQMKRAQDAAQATPEFIMVLQNIRSEIPLSRKDLEQYIGENLLSKVAVLIILVAVVILYMYFVNTGLITEQMRVAVGSLIGVAALFTGDRLAKTLPKMTTWLVALGTLSLFYTMSLSTEDYGMVSPPAAFITGWLMTIGIFGLSLRYQKKAIAFIGLLAGLIMPALVNGNQQGSPLIYLTYITTLLGMLAVLAVWKQWKQLLTFAWVVWWGVLIALLIPGRPIDYYQIYTPFVLVFYLSFFIAFLTYNIRNTPEEDEGTYGYWLLIFGNFFYWLLGIHCLNMLGMQDQWALIFGGISALHFYYALMVFGKGNFPMDLRNMLLTFGVVLSAVAIFSRFKMLYVNTFWAVEAVILAWLGIELKNKVLRNAAAFMIGGALISMFYNWTQTYWSSQFAPVFVLNSGFWAGIVTICSLSLLILLFNSDEEEYDIVILNKEYYTKSLGSILLIIGYFTGMFELLWHTPNLVGGTALRTIMIDAYTMSYAVLVRFIVYRLDIERMKFTAGAMITMSIIFYILFGQVETLALRGQFLEKELPFYPFGFHYVNLLLTFGLIYTQIRDVVRSEGYASGKYSYILWYLCIVAVFHLTYELEHVSVILQALVLDLHIEEALEQIRLTGFSILWSLISFVLMYIGIRNKIKELRLIALVLFAVTIVKFFSFDFWRLGLIGRISALISIGLLLLAVSRLYSSIRLLVGQGEFHFDRDKKYTQEETAELMRLLKKQQQKQQEEQDDDDA